MRTIIAGSRNIVDKIAIYQHIENSPIDITTVISGGAHGVDSIGEMWARANSLPLEIYLAKWKYGRAAGLFRNELMAKKADALIAIWDGQSNGTRHMIKTARLAGLIVHVVVVE